jgi:hypothetical protein
MGDARDVYARLGQVRCSNGGLQVFGCLGECCHYITIAGLKPACVQSISMPHGVLFSLTCVTFLLKFYREI